ncbi:hypothetical protein RND81_08G088900 [Saponaria officinalis]
MHYMQRGFLFNMPTTSHRFSINTFLDKMKHSLSYALDYYYPLAGRFVTVRYDDEQACSIYVDPNKGPGARFIHASAVSVSVSEIASYSPLVLPIIRSFFEFGEPGVINYDGHTRALVAIQVTELEDGIFIGLTMNHSIADGTSLWHFINSLSEIFNSLDDNMMMTTKLSHIPIFNPVLPAGCSPIQKLPYLELPEEYIRRTDVDPQLSQRIFHLSSASIEKLKEQANSERGNVGLGQISSFQAVAAHVWIAVNRARKSPLEETTTCFVAMNYRSRFNPPLSSDHFGVMILPILVTRKVDELLENGLGWVAVQLHETISANDEQAIEGTLKAIMQKPFVLRPDDITTESRQKQRLVSFAGSTRFDMYGPDFGFGKAVAVPTGYSDKADGKVTMNAGREGGGSVDIEVCLSPHTMLSLESDQEFMAFVS